VGVIAYWWLTYQHPLVHVIVDAVFGDPDVTVYLAGPENTTQVTFILLSLKSLIDNVN